MKYFFIFFIFFSLQLSCKKANTPNFTPLKEGVMTYKDFDLFTFKGINKVTGSSFEYPYLTISTNNQDTSVIKIQFNKEKEVKWNYYLNGDFEVCEFKRKEKDDGLIHEFFFILNSNGYLEVEYMIPNEMLGKKYLLKVAEHTGEKSEIYFFSRFSKIPFLLSNRLSDYSLPLATMLEKRFLSTTSEKGILKIESQLIKLKSNLLINQDVSCYELNGISYFWWNQISIPPSLCED